jgi:hypothetical protein
MFNGLQYKIEWLNFKRTFIGKHWKRTWITLEYDFGLYRGIPVFDDKEGAIKRVKQERAKDYDKRIKRKKDAAMKQNIWKKVWP